jgi:hypothetical protein
VAGCLQAGLTYAAIADHNTVGGIEDAQKAAQGTGLGIIPALELDCVFDGVNLHILGYGIDYSAAVFARIAHDLHQQERDNSARLMQGVRQLGIEFDDEMITKLAYDGVVTGEMIAEAALAYDAKAENPLLDPYRGEGARSDNPYVNFYWDYCSQGKPAYTPFDFMNLDQAIDVIVSHQGVPVLAHPGINIKEESELLEAILARGVLGIEVYTSYHHPEQVRFYRDAALSKDLLMTCGSDFHGKTKKSIQLGGVHCGGHETSIIEELTSQIKGL